MMVAGAAILAACVPQTHVEGQRIRASAETVVERVDVTGGLHDRAPRWFKDYWAEYLVRVRGSYAVMALDRKLRAAHYVYCPGACTNLIGGQHQSWKDVNYKHGALKACRETVREEFPAEKPACSIYAVRDKIVWKGALPWE